MTYAEFVRQWNGKGIDFDGVYGNQCVDLAKQYLKDCFGIQAGAWGNACAYWTNTNPAILARFDKVANGATNIPKQGDIVVYRCDTPGSGGAGHIEIFDRKSGAGRFVAFSQNWGGQYAHMVEHADNYKYVLGWLTPKTITQGGEMVTNDDASRQLGFHLLGRNGKDGRPNALTSKQNDLVGKELTNAWLTQLFLSAESRDWRDRRLPNIYSERDRLKAQVTQFDKAYQDEKALYQRASAELASTGEQLTKAREELTLLATTNKELEAKILELKTNTAVNEDTVNLNKLGELLKWVIKRIGGVK